MRKRKSVSFQGVLKITFPTFDFIFNRCDRTISGDKNNEYTRDSGTSESAPIITSLAALVKQKFPKISGPEVIQKLKDTALPLGEPRFTGLGYVWAPAALEIMEN